MRRTLGVHGRELCAASICRRGIDASISISSYVPYVASSCSLSVLWTVTMPLALFAATVDGVESLENCVRRCGWQSLCDCARNRVVAYLACPLWRL
ncbi:hypothetical protein BDW22DRAFT_318767 [Trametopsis cervina]|nr:hypothetical protein BDW22DRAFT_318767 [Trametopsis cervina]